MLSERSSERGLDGQADRTATNAGRTCLEQELFKAEKGSVDPEDDLLRAAKSAVERLVRGGIRADAAIAAFVVRISGRNKPAGK